MTHNLLFLDSFLYLYSLLCKYLYIMNIEASKRIRIKIMANISALQNPMTILFVETIEAVINEMCASIFILFL